MRVQNSELLHRSSDKYRGSFYFVGSNVLKSAKKNNTLVLRNINNNDYASSTNSQIRTEGERHNPMMPKLYQLINDVNQYMGKDNNDTEDQNQI